MGEGKIECLCRCIDRFARRYHLAGDGSRDQNPSGIQLQHMFDHMLGQVHDPTQFNSTIFNSVSRSVSAKSPPTPMPALMQATSSGRPDP